MVGVGVLDREAGQRRVAAAVVGSGVGRGRGGIGVGAARAIAARREREQGGDEGAAHGRQYRTADGRHSGIRCGGAQLRGRVATTQPATGFVDTSRRTKGHES